MSQKVPFSWNIRNLLICFVVDFFKFFGASGSSMNTSNKNIHKLIHTYAYKHTKTYTRKRKSVMNDLFYDNTSQFIFTCWTYKWLKSYCFGKMSSTHCLKQISSNQKYFVLQNYFLLGNSNSFPKSILHRVNLNIFFSNFVYSMSDDKVYYIDSAMVLSAEKQRSFRSFVSKG